MGKDRPRIGLVGCGIISEIQAAAIQRTENASLVSVHSRSQENAKRVGEKYHVSWFTDYDEFLSDDNLDIVSVCTPSGSHLDYGAKAARAGKHVVVEKPIEVTLDNARQLIDICHGEGVRLAVIYQSRFIPAIRQMKRRIENGELGEIFSASAYVKWFRSQAYYDSADWRGTFDLDGGGVLINQAIHTIDLLQWIAGDIHSVCSQIDTLTHKNIEGEDNAVAAVRFKSGAIGIIEGSTSVQPSMPRKLEIHGDKGTAILTGDDARFSFAEDANRENDFLITDIPSGAMYQGYYLEPHQFQFEAIANAILSDEQPPVSGEEALKSLAIISAMYESAKNQKYVVLNG